MPQVSHMLITLSNQDYFTSKGNTAQGFKRYAKYHDKYTITITRYHDKYTITITKYHDTITITNVRLGLFNELKNTCV